jgi:hypothetical protein
VGNNFKPQVGHSDEGYDEDGTVDESNICLQERRILKRVGNYLLWTRPGNWERELGKVSLTSWETTSTPKLVIRMKGTTKTGLWMSPTYVSKSGVS